MEVGDTIESMSSIMPPKRTGFTIVELLIVIVVIGVIAAITVVAFSGVQARARDTARKNDLAQLSKATKLYAVDNGDYAEVNCGASGNGWLVADYDGAGPALPINTCLTNGGYLSKILADPGGLSACGGLTCYAYMKGSCGLGTYYYAHLETMPQTSTDLDATCNPGYDTAYGMNYIHRVN